MKQTFLSLKVIACSFFALSIFSCSEKIRQKQPGEIKSVLVLGNSIVQHGEAPQIGWHGNWGMAASALDSDFVHQLVAEIWKRDPTVRYQCANMVGFEGQLDNFDYTRLDTLPKSDMLILRFSENVDDSLVTNGAFVRSYDKLIAHIDPDGSAVKVIVSGIWHRPHTNRLLEQYAAERHYIFVKNDDLLADSSNSAYGLFAEPGVAAHPSDKGMRMIKDRIWAQVQSYFPPHK